MTTTLRNHPAVIIAELVKDLRPDLQTIVTESIVRMLDRAESYQERMDEARDLERQFKALEHNHPPFVAPETPCPCCSVEDEYLVVLGSADRSRALIEGRR